VKTLEELWFPPDDTLKHADDRTKVVASLPVILSVVGNRERQTNIQEFLHKVIHRLNGSIVCLYVFQVVADKAEKEATVLVEQYARICDALIDTLVDGQELQGFVSRARAVVPFSTFLQSLLNCIKTVHLFVAAKPSIISSTKAATLLPYLKHATNARTSASSSGLI
jgi:cohesin loading factor subunit SCC2